MRELCEPGRSALIGIEILLIEQGMTFRFLCRILYILFSSNYFNNYSIEPTNVIVYKSTENEASDLIPSIFKRNAAQVVIQFGCGDGFPLRGLVYSI